MNVEKYKEEFKAIERKYVYGRQAEQIVSWDWRVNTPKLAASDRANVIGLLSEQNHRLLTHKKTREVLDYLWSERENSRLDGHLVSRIRLLKRESDRNAKIPSALLSEFSVLKAKSEAAWEEAKRTDNWELYQPHLKNMFDYSKKCIELWGYEGSPYNALLGYEEEGMSAEKLQELFDDTKKGLVPLVAKIKDCAVQIDDSLCQQKFPIEKQKVLAHKLLDVIGFDLKKGLLAESEHPYTTSFGNKDVRMTTHYYEDKFLPAIFSTLHEGGHGMYEQCVNEALEGTIAGHGLHGGFHESVSRFWENRVGRSESFWKANMEMFQALFPEQLYEADARYMYRAVNKSGISMTRMEADELTYNLHIMLRVELERGVFEGKYEVEDLPGLWNEKMKQYLGVVPENNTKGILQDIQWSMAQFGYFPSYFLGNLYNAQYTHGMKKELDVEGLIEQGKISVIFDWMKENIYQFGSTKTPKEMIMALTGEEISAKYFLEYVNKKYSDLYEL